MHDFHSLFEFHQLFILVYSPSPYICITFPYTHTCPILATKKHAQYSADAGTYRRLRAVAPYICIRLHISTPEISERFIFIFIQYWKSSMHSFSFSFLFIFVTVLVSLDAMQCLTRNDVRAILPLSPFPALSARC